MKTLSNTPQDQKQRLRTASDRSDTPKDQKRDKNRTAGSVRGAKQMEKCKIRK